MKKHNFILTLLTGNYLLGNWLLISLFLMCSHESQVWASTDWTQLCSSCSCLWENGKKKADCTNRKANSISSFKNISHEIEIIALARNDIYSLKSDEFNHLKLNDLKQILLDDNIITNIDPNAFQGLKNLDTLDLSANRLGNIDPKVFEPLINLQELRLRKNKIHFSDSFPKLPSLKRLDLSFCNLSTLTPGIFKNLETVTNLQLNNNHFSELSADVLKPLYNLKELNLLVNRWSCDCHTRELFKWTSLKKLALTTTCENLDGRWESLRDDDFVCKPIINLFHVYLAGELHQGPMISVDRGSDITIECQVEADPRPKISWLRDNKELVTSDKYVFASSGVSDGSSNLTIKDISGNDAGAFTCVGVQISGDNENKVERSVEVSLAGGIVIGGSTGGRRSSKTWLWILLGILGFFFLVALIVLLVFFCLRRRRYRRKTHDQRQFRIEKKEPVGDQVDATTVPLIEKPAPTMVETMVPLKAEPEPSESNYAEVRAMTPMPQNGYAPSIYGYNPPLTKTYLSNSQVYLPRELHYHPGGYATYDPRRAPNNPIEINFRQAPNPYGNGRLYSPFSGSVASFQSEPPARVPHGLGYVTLPRRRRVPSWSPAYGGVYPKTHVPPSPTGSLPPVPNLRTRYQPMGPRFDSIGPRTTADGGSNLSLNKVGLSQTPQTPIKTPAGYLTPGTPATPSSARLPRTFTPLTPSSGRIPKSSTSLQNYKGIPGTHFNFDPIEENDGPVTPTVTDRPLQFPTPTNTSSIPTSGAGQDLPKKIPPVPPAKPKRKSQNFDDQNVQDISTIVGTEV